MKKEGVDSVKGREWKRKVVSGGIRREGVDSGKDREGKRR